MSSRVRNPIITIDEEACTGCGLCVTECAEGAITIVDGKARVVGDGLCDGIGACLGVCPAGALTIEAAADTPADEQAELAPRSQGDSASEAAPQAGPDTQEEVCVCSLCHASEEAVTLVAIRIAGQNGWCCTRCLPGLIHS